MELRLPPEGLARQDMRISVSGQQQCLEHQHGAVPDSWRPAQPRQRHARDHRLYQEQQETADENVATNSQRRAGPASALIVDGQSG